MSTSMMEDNFEDDQLASMSTDDINRASRLLDNELRVLKVSDLFFTCYARVYMHCSASFVQYWSWNSSEFYFCLDIA